MPDSPRSIRVGLAEVVGKLSGDLNSFMTHPWDRVPVGSIPTSQSITYRSGIYQPIAVINTKVRPTGNVYP